MERGVYVATFGGVTELAAVDRTGEIIRRLTVRTDLYDEKDSEEMRRWLDSTSPPSALRLV